MPDPYLGEIRMFAGNFAPLGWAFCDGSLLLVDLNMDLFDLIGTTYGGDGDSTFGLPDLRGRMPIHLGTGPGLTSHVIGEQGGAERVTLTSAQMPAHSHPLSAAAGAGTTANPAGNYPASGSSTLFHAEHAPDATLHPAALTGAGNSVDHDNRMPYLTINYIIAVLGVFPSGT